MIIDEILSVREHPEMYNAREFYSDVMSYRYLWPSVCDPITRAMDAGTNEDVQNELCEYVFKSGYNPQICRFILNFNWI